MKAFLGMGHLGSNFVKAMLRKGEQVQVWNRTASKAKALEADGAKAFDKVEDAVHGADIIHLTLRDDDTVNEVLAMAKGGLKPGAIIADHTTTSAAGAVARTKEWADLGYTYLHVPVFMGPPNALESTGSMLVSGDQEVIAKLTDDLSKWTGQVLNFGPEVGKAAGMKLIGNLFLIALTGGFADMISLAKAMGISVDDIFTLFESWNPGAVAPARLKKMTSANFDQPSWELNMARKDAGLMMNEAKLGGTNLIALPAIASEMDRWIAKGHGNDDWTVIGKDALSKR
jgi:3-hydroxyisobutyrate dehydrogenase